MSSPNISEPNPRRSFRMRQKLTSYNEQRKDLKQVINENDLTLIIDYVKKHRPSSTSVGEKLDLLLLNAKLRYEFEHDKKKKEKEE